MSLLQEQAGNEAKDDGLSEITNRNKVLQKMEEISQRVNDKGSARLKSNSVEIVNGQEKMSMQNNFGKTIAEHSRVSQDLAVEDETSLDFTLAIINNKKYYLSKKYLFKILETKYLFHSSINCSKLLFLFIILNFSSIFINLYYSSLFFFIIHFYYFLLICKLF
ncbi:hypothetical protein RFI_24846 [Reticulomyxa filosa]|uniref:Uncharacterized protein n=1 Tax=Reticulomyxa filosa TaxID=46433 RepID=X6MFS9_RETFI|nr:hypothetical protein RFI_24846 [Reticulomyxa filosa]|eukprot:ETO12531.1 hypothetical protein RFI_24846 [Reticulomyxa filosa]